MNYIEKDKNIDLEPLRIRSKSVLCYKFGIDLFTRLTNNIKLF